MIDESFDKIVWLVYNSLNAPMAELVDALDLGSSAVRCKSSSLFWGTKLRKRGRVVEGTSLLTKQTERFREFESLRFRHFME